MSIDFSQFLPHVLPSVPGCPRGAALHEISMAVREFCERSLIWRERLTDIDSVVGQAEYLLAPVTSGADIVLPTWVAYNGADLIAKSEEELDIIDNGWRTKDNGTPQYFNMLSEPEGTLQLNRKSESVIVDGIKVKVALKPAIDYATGPDFLYNKWMEAIAHGAKRRLMIIPDKKWSNLKISNGHGIKFNYYINQALAQATKGNTRKPSRVRMRNWV